MEIEQSQLSWPEIVLTSKFAVHFESLDLIERGLKESLHRKAQELRTAARAAENGEVYDELISQVYEYEEELKGGRLMAIAFNSFFAVSLALFEHTLIHICKQAQRDARCPISIKLLGTRNSLDRAKDYLEALGIKFPSCEPEWGEIKLYRQIRNKVIHEGATLKEGNRCLLTYVREKQVVSKWSERDLELTRPFCEEALENLERFIIKTHRAYSRWRQAEIVGDEI